MGSKNVLKFDVVAFDADDTLWHNETFYYQGKELFQRLFAGRLDPDVVVQKLSQIEIDNIRHYGYGIKSFVLSMVETAMQLSDGQLQGVMVGEILAYAKRVLHADLELFAGVEAVLEDLCNDQVLMLITKGDLFEQHLKIARSGLSGYFRYIEVLAEKRPEDYAALLEKLGVRPERFIMIGNSLRSDILPALEIGGQAVYIPYDDTWQHEAVLDRPLQQDEYHQLEDIRQVPEFIKRLTGVVR